jgi:hypothetical protein
MITADVTKPADDAAKTTYNKVSICKCLKS